APGGAGGRLGFFDRGLAAAGILTFRPRSGRGRDFDLSTAVWPRPGFLQCEEVWPSVHGRSGGFAPGGWDGSG
ncbi:MAG TPA: hypothetical protein VHI52_09705, partial [Verrucomicrobiae bacterium]|nr:hypothetical protein [Verrucomicrobiae bacterium]